MIYSLMQAIDIEFLSQLNYNLSSVFKQSGSDGKIELVDDFIDKLIFDNKLTCSQSDLKICTVLKNKKSVNVVIESTPSIYKLLLARGYVFWDGLDVGLKSISISSVVLNVVSLVILKKIVAVMSVYVSSVQTPMRLKLQLHSCMLR
nr:unnamed protein product [Callosobruchus chinensis]